MYFVCNLGFGINKDRCLKKKTLKKYMGRHIRPELPVKPNGVLMGPKKRRKKQLNWWMISDEEVCRSRGFSPATNSTGGYGTVSLQTFHKHQSKKIYHLAMVSLSLSVSCVRFSLYNFWNHSFQLPIGFDESYK